MTIDISQYIDDLKTQNYNMIHMLNKANEKVLELTETNKHLLYLLKNSENSSSVLDKALKECVAVLQDLKK